MDGKTISLIEELIRSNKRLQDKINNLKLKIQFGLVSKEEFKEKLSEIENIYKELHNKIEEVENNLISQKKELYLKIQEISKIVKDLQTHILSAASIKDFVKLNSDIADIQRRISDISDSIENLKDKVKAFENLKDSIDKLKVEVENLSSKVNNNETEITNLKEDIKELKSLKNNISYVESRIKKLESDYDSITSYLQKIENNLDFSKYSNLLKDIDDLKIEIKKVKDKLSNLSRELLSLSSINIPEINKITQGYSNLLTNVIELNKKLSLLESKVIDIDKRVEREMDKIKKKLYSEDVEDRISSILQTIKKLESRIEDIKNIEDKFDNKKVLEEIREMNDLIVTISRELDQVKKEVEEIKMKIHIENIEEVLDSFEKIKILEEEIKNLKKVIKQKTTIKPLASTSDMDYKLYRLEKAISRLIEQNTYLEKFVREELRKIWQELRYNRI